MSLMIDILLQPYALCWVHPLLNTCAEVGYVILSGMIRVSYFISLGI